MKTTDLEPLLLIYCILTLQYIVQMICSLLINFSFLLQGRQVRANQNHQIIFNVAQIDIFQQNIMTS